MSSEINRQLCRLSHIHLLSQINPPAILSSPQQECRGLLGAKLRDSTSAAAAAAAGGLEEVICRLQGFLITPKLLFVLMPLLALPSAKTSAIKACGRRSTR